MTYFELYDLPISLKIDAIQLKQKFYELSRKFHPDFFSQASENEQVDALEKSALINKAFKIFCGWLPCFKSMNKEGPNKP